MTHHLLAVELYRQPNTSTMPAPVDRVIEVRSVPNLNPPTPVSRVKVLLPAPSCFSSQMTIWPEPGLVGAPRIRFPPRVTWKLRPVLASVAMVGASVRATGEPRYARPRVAELLAVTISAWVPAWKAWSIPPELAASRSPLVYPLT